MTVVTARTVLLVEDNGLLRGMVAQLLDDEGYAVLEADDGPSAIAVLRAHRPPDDALCLVILDMTLPTLDGVEVLQALADYGRHVPVVAVSADRGQLARAARAGAQATLEKPFDLDRLLAVVARNCGR